MKSPKDQEQKQKNESSQELVRLNVFLQEHGVASRRKADELIQAGKVMVDGKIVRELGCKIPRTARVMVDGKLLREKQKLVTYMLYKPDMVLTSRTDPQGRATIFSLPEVKKIPYMVQPVGRLDYRSEGLLLLTNDGDLAYALTHPRFSVEKRYACLVNDVVTAEDVEKLRTGVMLDDGFARPLSVRIGNKEKLGATSGQWLEIVVTEGRNRLVRRMLAKLGLKVLRLVRVAIGEVELPYDFKPGDVMPLKGEALAYLQKLKEEYLASKQKGSATSDLQISSKKVKRTSARKVPEDVYQQQKQAFYKELEQKHKERKQKRQKRWVRSSS